MIENKRNTGGNQIGVRKAGLPPFVTRLPALPHCDECLWLHPSPPQHSTLPHCVALHEDRILKGFVRYHVTYY
jgi:hypothetical protein